jgi:hypothetical protein
MFSERGVSRKVAKNAKCLIFEDEDGLVAALPLGASATLWIVDNLSLIHEMH